MFAQSLVLTVQEVCGLAGKAEAFYGRNKVREVYNEFEGVWLLCQRVLHSLLASLAACHSDALNLHV